MKISRLRTRVFAADVLLTVILAGVGTVAYDIWHASGTQPVHAAHATSIKDQQTIYDLTHGTMPVGLTFPTLSPAREFIFPLTTWTQSGYGFGDTWTGADGSHYPVCSATGQPYRHAGIDIGSGVAPVRAVADGMIVGFLDDPQYGRAILLRHQLVGSVVSTVYWHVNSLPGYGIERRVHIGEVFATVSPLYAHLHFGVWDGEVADGAWRGALPVSACNGFPGFPGKFVDPTAFLNSHVALSQALSQ